MHVQFPTAALSAAAGFLIGIMVFFPSTSPYISEADASDLAAMPALRSVAAQGSSLGFAQSMRGSTAIRAEELGRREMMGGAMAVAGAALTGQAAKAEVGVGARMFKETASNPTGFVPYVAPTKEFSMLLPSKWNPSKEKDFPGMQLRYEDNFDAVNNLMVIKEKTDKAKIEDYGAPEKFLDQFSYLLGTQSYGGKTVSEGGFAPDRVSAASVLDVQATTDKKGRSVYKYNILSRTADGDEGGRHQLISAVVNGGDLWILKIQVGDKRWFKGAKKEAEGAFNSFIVSA